VPANLTNVCEIAAGERYGAGLRPDGSVVLWTYPVPEVPQGMTIVACLGAGANHCVSLGNITPVAVNLNSATYVNSDLVVKLPAVDPDGDALTYRIISQPGAGTLYQYVNGNRGAAVVGANAPLSDPFGNVIFAPAPGALGTPYTSFTFLAHDEELSSPARTVTISSTLPLSPSISGQKSGWSKLSAPTLQHAQVQMGGAFAFDFNGYTNVNYQVWASTNLVNWEPLGEASVSGGHSFRFVDPEAAKWPRRFYRATTPMKGGFLVQFSGSPNATYSVWGSTNLIAWDRIGTATAVSNGWYEFFDSDSISFGKRFYRGGAP
jgi:hypothetical protein